MLFFITEVTYLNQAFFFFLLLLHYYTEKYLRALITFMIIVDDFEQLCLIICEQKEQLSKIKPIFLLL